MATIPKKDLVNRITNSTGAKQVLVRAVVQQFLDEITAELAQGNRLEFRDFGVFETSVSQPRTAQNPKTLERIEARMEFLSQMYAAEQPPEDSDPGSEETGEEKG